MLSAARWAACITRFLPCRAASRGRPRDDPRMAPKHKPGLQTRSGEETCGPVARDRSGAVTITVHAKPGARRSSVTEVSPEAVGISIAAPPADGAANTELVRYLAQVLDLRRTHVVLDKGSRCRDKLVKVTTSLSPEEVLRRLKEESGGGGAPS
ncbi:UPF0235 protein C15orf40 homolog [Lampris incognitus]|uniref:UPF0235 protein C15orf40 homolog n=1 Tax=Lampris incognitus TaxID=2546036 RepID=UPI0024B4F881|nr:UPF0235 protein C15orf40 homolog [Lampris incognitus]